MDFHNDWQWCITQLKQSGIGKKIDSTRRSNRDKKLGILNDAIEDVRGGGGAGGGTLTRILVQLLIDVWHRNIVDM